MTAKNSGKMIFGKKWQMSAYSLQSKIVSKSLYFAPFSKINAVLDFTQKFKMAAKNGGKTIFGKKWQMTRYITCEFKISLKSLYLTPFL